MPLKKSLNPNCNESFQQLQLEQIPNRSVNMHSQLIPLHKSEEDKNISSEYEEIQLRTLTKWINVQLSQVGEHITHIDSDLKDGKRLLKLLSVVAKNPNLRPEKGNMRIHQLSNVAQSLNFLQEQWGIDSLPAVANEAIVNGDTKSTLAITFFIMLKYQVHPILLTKTSSTIHHPPSSPLPSINDTKSRPTAEAKIMLLYWVQFQLSDYIANHIIANVQDFSRSWRSGLVFCLLLHRHDPELVPTLFMDLLQQPLSKSMWYTLLSLAFDVAEDQLNIPRYLDPEDLLVEYPHEPSVMMYVSEMYNKLTSEDNKREKRLNDIALLSPDDTLSQNTLYDSITPSDSSTRADNEESPLEELQNPYQQLDFLLSCIQSHMSEDKETLQLMFNSTFQSIHDSNLTTQEKQALDIKCKHLQINWEAKNKYLHEIVPRNERGEPVHPLDGTMEMADTFDLAVSRLNVDQDSLQVLQDRCQLFRQGILFSQITAAIRDEIDVIQNLMRSSSMTSDVVRNLEQRMYIVSTTMEGVRDQYLFNDARFVDCMDELEDRYEKVLHWVDEVRQWASEAERIQDWISTHIQLIEALNNKCDFDPVSQELNIDEEQAMQLHQEHEKLKMEIDGFDNNDMAQLKSHVNMLTLSQESKSELTPADTSMIEITLTTLNMLNKVTHLLNQRSHRIQLILLRIKWENMFVDAVEWIASTDEQIDDFLRNRARWSESEESSYDKKNIEEIIKTLVSLEHQVSDFDHGSYSDVLDAYQELEGVYRQKLPDYLELRQVGFEKSFEDLMKRTSFTRKVVEQLLSMKNTVDKFKELRQIGEILRLVDTIEDEEIYAEKVQLFKEESALLITNVSAYIPYPIAPEISTSIGAHDAYNTDITNGNIKSTINTYSMSLALIADVLDQLLISLHQTTSLQSRSREALKTMDSLNSWMDEQFALLNKTCFETLLNHMILPAVLDSKQASPTYINSSNPAIALTTSEDLYCLQKERDTIAQKLHQIENDDLSKCYSNVHDLEKDIDISNAVSIDHYSIVSSLERLEKNHQDLKQILSYRGLQLDVLKKCNDWENHTSKVNNNILTISRKMQDFIFKKALYDPSTEDTDKPSYQGDREIIQTLHFLQERVVELEERAFTPLQDMYTILNECYQNLTKYQSENNVSQTILPDNIETKQYYLISKYKDLKKFSQYIADIVTQRACITEFLLRAQDSFHEGEKLKDAFAKRTRLIMADDKDANITLLDRVDEFKKGIKNIWEDCGKNMIFPVYNGGFQQKDRYNPEGVIVRIKELLEKKMEGLSLLETAIDACMQSYKNASDMKELVINCEQEVFELSHWIDQQIKRLQSQYFDVSSECFLPQGVLISDLRQTQEEMVQHTDDFEYDKVKVLHDRIVQFIDKSNKSNVNTVVDISPAANKFALMINQFAQLRQGLCDQSIVLDAATKRLEWEEQLTYGITRLQSMNDEVSQFILKKNQIISQEDLDFDQVQDLQKDLSNLVCQKDTFQTIIYPPIQSSYDSIIEFFPKLPKPIATPDHLEMRMEFLNGLSTRLQENIDHRSDELRFIKQRLNWEDAAKQSLIYLSNQEKTIENFVEEKVRWSGNLNPISENIQESVLRDEWSSLALRSKDYEESVIDPLKKEYELLMNEISLHYNDTLASHNPVMKKMGDVLRAQDCTHYYLEFSKNMVDQQCIISTIILKTYKLEQSAEVIREELVSINLSSGDSQVIHLLENHSEKIEHFKIDMQDMQVNLVAKLPFPVRTLGHISVQAKQKDEETNSAIRETVSLYSSRLDRILSSLQLLLESKERVSRRRLSLHYYKKQVKITETWIDTNHQLLLKISSALTEADIIVSGEFVCQITNIEQTMISNDNVLTALIIVYEKCVTAFGEPSLPTEDTQEDDQQPLIHDFQNFVHPTQNQLNLAWNDLLELAVKTRKDSQIHLIEVKVRFWLSSLNTMLIKVKDTDECTISKEELRIFDEELSHLENNGYKSLKSNFEACLSLFDKHSIHSTSQLFKEGLQIIQCLKDKISFLAIRVQLHERINEYKSEVSKLLKQIKEYGMILNTIIDGYKTTLVNSTSANRQVAHQTLVAKFKGVTEHIKSLDSVLDGVTEQYKCIKQQNESFPNEIQADLQQSWDQLQGQHSNLSLLIVRSSKWTHIFSLMDRARFDIQSVEARINDNITEFMSTMGEALSKIQSIFHKDLKITDADLLEDSINSRLYEADYKSLLSRLEDIEKKIDNYQFQKKQMCLVQSLKDKVNVLTSRVRNQLVIAKNYCERFCLALSDKQGLVSTIAANKVIQESGVVASSCQQELQFIQINYCSKLTKEYNWLDSEKSLIVDPVTQALDKLESFTAIEQQHIDLAIKSQQYLSLQLNVNTAIENYTKRVDTVDFSNQAILDLEDEFETLKEASEKLEKLYKNVLQCDFKNNSCKQSCLGIASKLIHERQQKTDELFAKAKRVLKKTKQEINNHIKHEKIIEELESIATMIENMANCVSLFDVHQTSLIDKEVEFNRMCSEFQSSLDIKRSFADSLIHDYTGASQNKEIQILQERILSSIVHLDSIVDLKRKEFGQREDASTFLSMTISFEKHIASLISIIDKASPNHFNVMNGKFVKSDLQLLLKNFVKAFKEHKRIINRLVEEAAGESKKDYLEGNLEITEGLAKMKRRWGNVQSVAAARERELKMCINRLDHEFFTKLAMAKKTTNVAPRTSQSISYSRGTVSPIPFKENNLAKAQSTKRKLYVPNPDSELDVELGQIVNSAPYKVTVKVVPDQIGKYWFGDTNPRLVYCRILSSKLVMVRVGGGWVELSKFLREHGFMDGTSSRPNSVNRNRSQEECMPFQEAYFFNKRSVSPTNRITIRGGGGLVPKSSSSITSSKVSSSSPRSPLPGYVDGDRFVSIDENGNRYFVKMKKASADAKTPVISKKKASNHS